MSSKLTRDAYEKLLTENILWLKSQAPEDSLERRHIELVLQHSLLVEYDITPELQDALRLRAQRDEAVEALRELQWSEHTFKGEMKCRFCGEITEWEKDREAHNCPNFPGVKAPQGIIQ